MGKYLELADKALKGFYELNEKSPNRTGTDKSCKSIGRTSTHSRDYERNELNELTNNRKLRILAGDDWDELVADPEQLRGFAAAARTVDQIRNGIVPEHYTSITECKYCGPVYVFPGLPAESPGCVWCLNRHKGTHIPRAGT